jgi:hypothetical protein
MGKIIGTFFLLMFLSQIVSAQIVPYTADDHTVLLDHFDGTTGASILANSWNITPCGAAKPAATPSYSYKSGPNGLNQALNLNAPAGQPFGSSTYLQYPGGQLLSQSNGTIEFWVYLTTYVTGWHLVDQGPYYNSCAGWTFWEYVDSTGQLVAGAWAAFSLTSGSVKVPLNTWTHVATSWGSTGAKLYINGVLVGSDANTGMPAAGYGGSVLISLCTPTGASGSIDELRISNVQRTTFNVASPSPSITSFSPTSGPIGTRVTITGTNFSTTAANNIVYFGAVKAMVTTATSTSLTVSVPTGATYQPISVTVGGLTGYSSRPFIVTFLTTGTITSGSFAPKVDFVTGENPFGIAIGDIDGDGKPDLVVINNNSNTVSVFRNTSSSGSITSGSFAAKVDFTTGAGTFNVAIGDIDGDGKQDLVVANAISNTVSVFRNTSASGSITSGSFAAKVDFATGENPFGIAIGDIDGDGKPDIVIVNHLSSTVSVFRNTSSSGSITSGSFAAKVDFATGESPFDVAIGDIDGDGKPDLVVSNWFSNSVSVLRNTSTPGSITSGSFAAKVDFTTGSSPYGIAIGDIDGDGKPDLVVSNNNSDAVSIFRNTSSSGSITSGSFAAKVDFATGVYPIGIAISDIDGDGKPDLIVTNWNGKTVSVFRNTSSSGSITPGSLAAKVDFATGLTPYGIAIGDLDGDGKPDLVATNANNNTVSVFWNGNTPPAAPQNLVATAGNGQVTLKWSKNTEVDFLRYRIYRGTTPNPTTKVDSTIGGVTDTIKVNLGLTNGQIYYFRVTAVDNSGLESGFSNEVIVTPTASPSIVSIKDVPYDQGGRVSLVWSASVLDTNVNILPSYNIWRSSPERLLSNSPFISIQEQSKSFITNIRTMAVNGIIYSWECIGTQPAHRFSTYSFTAATLYDSMSTTNGKHYFIVSALTNDPNVFYDSKIDSGYSVDNLPPLPPQNLVGNIQSGKIILHWNANSESDLRGYTIYRSSNKVSEPDTLKEYAFTTDTSFIDNNPMMNLAAYYYIKAQDIHENLSKMSNQVSLKTTNIIENNIDIPTEYSLNQNYPNPFNPSTIIQYGLPARSSVRLVIYNVLGQVMKELVNTEQQAGYQSVIWNANVSSGMYFFRLEVISTENPIKRFVETRKMLLLR